MSREIEYKYEIYFHTLKKPAALYYFTYSWAQYRTQEAPFGTVLFILRI